MQQIVAVNTKLRFVDNYFTGNAPLQLKRSCDTNQPMNKEATKQLVLKAGGPRLLAARIGTSRQAVAKWDRVPAHWVRLIEELTGVPAEVIRPDVFARPLKSRGNGHRAAA